MGVGLVPEADLKRRCPEDPQNSNVNLDIDIYICAASGLAGILRFWGLFGDFLGVPAPGAEICLFCGFRRPGHVKYSVLGLPGLEKTSLLKP